MGITKEELNLMELFMDLGKICKTEKVCGKCEDVGCLIGYARDCAARCRKSGITYVPNGTEQIPVSDIKGGYDEYDVLYAIAHLMNQCRSCKEDHFENCLISIVRNCLEVIEFGDVQEYVGDPLSYMMKIKNLNPEKAELILEEYRKKKETQ